MISKLIAIEIKLYPEGGFKGSGPLGLESGHAEEAPEIFNRFISSLVGIMTIIAIIWFLFLFISGAIGIMTAGGDKAKAQDARTKITNGLLGLVVVIAAIFVIQVIGNILGVESILNPAEILKKINI